MRRPLHAACVVTSVPLVYRLYRLCTATFALGGTALTLVYQAKLYVVPLVPLLFLFIAYRKLHVTRVFLYIKVFDFRRYKRYKVRFRWDMRRNCVPLVLF